MDPRPLEPVLVSACLLGRNCRYDGNHNRDLALEAELASRGERALPFCPEEQGGLGTPRPAAWIEGEDAAAVLDGRARVVSEGGDDVTSQFRGGAKGAVDLCVRESIRRAYLKERSPSCGVRQTHVGGRLVDGPGVTTAALKRAGVERVSVEGRRAR